MRELQGKERAARKVMERLNKEHAAKLSEAKAALGIWSEVGIDESRATFWYSHALDAPCDISTKQTGFANAVLMSKLILIVALQAVFRGWQGIWSAADLLGHDAESLFFARSKYHIAADRTHFHRRHQLHCGDDL